MNITTIIAAIGTNPHIEESIRSAIPLSQEVVVINMGIHPQELKQIQEIQGVRIVDHEPVSHIELLREKSKEYAQTEYILFLDPDEIPPPSLVSALKERYEEYDVIKIPRKNMIMGKWIEHARWWPDYQIRLFKKESAVWPTEIHKQPETKGEELILEPKEELAIMHYNYNSLDEYLLKMIRYAKAEATTKFGNDDKYSLSEALKQGVNEFISRYYAADGYKDGMHGFALSFLQLMYYPLVYFYLWEMKKYEQVDEQELNESIGSFTTTLLHDSIHWCREKGIGLKNDLKRKLLQHLLQ